MPAVQAPIVVVSNVGVSAVAEAAVAVMNMCVIVVDVATKAVTALVDLPQSLTAVIMLCAIGYGGWL